MLKVLGKQRLNRTMRIIAPEDGAVVELFGQYLNSNSHMIQQLKGLEKKIPI